MGGCQLMFFHWRHVGQIATAQYEEWRRLCSCQRRPSSLFSRRSSLFSLTRRRKKTFGLATTMRRIVGKRLILGLHTFFGERQEQYMAISVIPGQGQNHSSCVRQFEFEFERPITGARQSRMAIAQR